MKNQQGHVTCIKMTAESSSTGLFIQFCDIMPSSLVRGTISVLAYPPQSYKHSIKYLLSFFLRVWDETTDDTVTQIESDKQQEDCLDVFDSPIVCLRSLQAVIATSVNDCIHRDCDSTVHFSSANAISVFRYAHVFNRPFASVVRSHSQLLASLVTLVPAHD